MMRDAAHRLALAGALLLIGCKSDGAGPDDGAVDTPLEEVDVGPVDGEEAEDVLDVHPPPCDGIEVTAFVGVNVVPMTEETVLSCQTLVVTDGRICALGPSATTTAPDGAAVVDGAGRWLLPGLADMHVHFNVEQDALLYVAAGVTTIRSMWGFPWVLAARDRIRIGASLGPEIWTTGPIMDGDPPVWSTSVVVTSPMQARDRVLEQAAAGYDFLKVYNHLALEVYDAIVEAGREVGLPVVGHVPEAVGLRHAIESGQASIEHLTGYDLAASDGTLERLTVERGVWNCPTMVVYDRYARLAEFQADPPDEMRYLHPQYAEEWSRLEPWSVYEMAVLQAKVAELENLGAPLIGGTDASNPYVVPGSSLHDELALLHGAGLSNYEVLLLVTSDAAEFLGVADRVGTIEFGMDADLLLLDGNPLESLEHARAPLGVMVKGRWWTREELQGLLDELAASWDEAFTLDWDCELPADHATPPAGDHAVFRLAGPISSSGGPYEWVAREFDVVIDGAAIDAGSQYTSVEMTIPSMLSVYVFGRPVEVEPGLSSYSFLQLILPAAALRNALDTGVPELSTDGVVLGEALVEMKVVGEDGLFRMCPRAALGDDVTRRFWVCPSDNVDFAPGERLRLAGNVPLTGDPAALEAAFGSTACTCWRNSYVPLDCGDWEAAVPTDGP